MLFSDLQISRLPICDSRNLLLKYFQQICLLLLVISMSLVTRTCHLRKQFMSWNLFSRNTLEAFLFAMTLKCANVDAICRSSGENNWTNMNLFEISNQDLVCVNKHFLLLCKLIKYWRSLLISRFSLMKINVYPWEEILWHPRPQSFTISH